MPNPNESTKPELLKTKTKMKN